MILKVFTGKLKALTALSASTVSVASVSTSATLSSDTRGSAVEVLTTTVPTIIEQASSLTNTYVVEPATNVGNKYKGFFDGIKEGFDLEKIKPVGEKYANFGTATASLVQKHVIGSDGEKQTGGKLITRDNFETVNYYAFEYARVVKTVLETIGPLLTGTINTIVKDGSDLGNISIQKLITIYQSDETKTLMSSALSQLQTYQSKLQQANNDDLKDAIKILFSPSTNDMVSSLTKIKDNIDSLSSKDASSFPDSKSLFKFMLLGENADKTIKEGATTAKTLVEEDTIKTLLKDIVEENDITELTKVLQGISGSTSDPAAAQ